MNGHIRRAREDAEQFGFRWDQLDAIRLSDFSGAKVVEVGTNFCSIHILVSKTGRSIRVFKNGVELK